MGGSHYRNETSVLHIHVAEVYRNFTALVLALITSHTFHLPYHFFSSHSPTPFTSLSSSTLLLFLPTHPSPSSLLLQHMLPGLCCLSASDATTSYSSPVDSGSSDDLRSHILDHRPKDSDVGVPLGTSVTVFCDKDVRTVNINKLFEVSVIKKLTKLLSQHYSCKAVYSGTAYLTDAFYSWPSLLLSIAC